MNFPKHWGDYGLNFGLDSKLTLCFHAGLPTIQYLIASSLVSKVGIIQIPTCMHFFGIDVGTRRWKKVELETEYYLASDTLVKGLACKTRGQGGFPKQCTYLHS